MADAESRRVEIQAKKMDGIDNQLAEIKKMLISKPKATGKDEKEKEGNSIWFDKERLKTVKAPEPKAVLVISNTQDSQKNTENHNTIEKALIDNEIALSKSYKNKTGDLVLVCESEEARDRLKNLVENNNGDIEMSTPKIDRKT